MVRRKRQWRCVEILQKIWNLACTHMGCVDVFGPEKGSPRSPVHEWSLPTSGSGIDATSADQSMTSAADEAISTSSTVHPRDPTRPLLDDEKDWSMSLNQRRNKRMSVCGHLVPRLLYPHVFLRACSRSSRTLFTHSCLTPLLIVFFLPGIYPI